MAEVLQESLKRWTGDEARRIVEAVRRHPNPERETWRETIVLTEDGEFTPVGANGPIRVADILPGPEPTGAPR